MKHNFSNWHCFRMTCFKDQVLSRQTNLALQDLDKRYETWDTVMQGGNGQKQALLCDLLRKAGTIKSLVALGVYSTSLQEQAGRPLLSLLISQFPLKILSPCLRFAGNQTAVQSVLSYLQKGMKIVLLENKTFCWGRRERGGMLVCERKWAKRIYFRRIFFKLLIKIQKLPVFLGMAVDVCQIKNFRNLQKLPRFDYLPFSCMSVYMSTSFVGKEQWKQNVFFNLSVLVWRKVFLSTFFFFFLIPLPRT